MLGPPAEVNVTSKLPSYCSYQVYGGLPAARYRVYLPGKTAVTIATKSAARRSDGD